MGLIVFNLMMWVGIPVFLFFFLWDLRGFVEWVLAGAPAGTVGLPKRRRPWISFLLTQFCPGVGQLYNNDFRWVWISVGASFVVALGSELFLFDSLGKLLTAVVLGLVVDLFLSVQAFVKSRRVREQALRPYQRWSVYLLFTVVLYGLPDGYGYLFPSRIRSFQIPSESMVPNLLVGDRLVADGWAYWGKDPKRGDIVVFDYPKDPGTNVLMGEFGLDHDHPLSKLLGYTYTKFVKRLVGLPGDKVEVRNGELYLNGKVVAQRRTNSPLLSRDGWQAVEYLEDLDGVEHVMQRMQPENDGNFGPVTVPEGKFFMMGDNRDRSSDSRVWGFVDRSALTGRMSYVYFAWDSEVWEQTHDLKQAIRWNRMGLQVR